MFRFIPPYILLITQFFLIPVSHGEDQRISNYRFDKAEITKKIQAIYPVLELNRGIEGWVVFSVVVDELGNVVEPILIDSSGRRNFELSARKAVKRMKYKPATLNGEPVKSSDNKLKVSFAIASKKPGAYRGFLSRYREIRRNLMDGKLDEIPQAIENLEEQHTKNRYETAWLHLLKSSYYYQTGDVEKYIAALRRAVWYNTEALPKEIVSSALINLYRGQVNSNLIVDALETADRAEELVEKMPNLSSIIENGHKLEDELDKHPVLVTKGSIQASDQPWRHNLYRKTIGVELLNGKLDRIEFRCSNKIRSFELDENTGSFNIPQSWKDCTVFIYGEAGTKLALLEQA